jgi:wobble nucleotide-excising tRNase
VAITGFDMLKKIIGIKNVGRFRNSASSGDTTLAKHAFIVGANGFGKTTICAVLRSLKTGDAEHVLGRKTLGVTDTATIELLLSSGAVRFNGTAWDTVHPAIAVFDGVFVAENVHSGEVVDIDHKRNLYRVIIGDAGVKLAKEDAKLAGESRAKTAEISAIAKALQPHVPTGTKLDAFIVVQNVSDIDNQIAAQELKLTATRQAAGIASRAVLSELVLPPLPGGFTDLLAMTIDDIGQDAEQRINAHLAAHGMEADGGDWIVKGIDHAAEESCPFCGQDIHGLPLITAYRAAFSERYKALGTAISTMKTEIGQAFGDTALARLETTAEQLKSGIEFWGRYCAFDVAPLAYPDGLADAIRGLSQSALSLLDSKARAPLDAVKVDEAFTKSFAAYAAIQDKAAIVNQAIRQVNTLATAKKAETGAADIRVDEAELARFKAIKTRNSAAVTALCDEHKRFSGEKVDIDTRKAAVRGKLDKHTSDVVTPYERSINQYLDGFNAGFSITETKHGYPGGVASSTYQIVINDTAVDVGDGKTPGSMPSFKNTLSAGDRSTLALAFFLAHLERDDELASKIVVFDDPFNSQDAFRRRQTIHEIMKVAGKCAQIIVLSHDVTFMKQIWDKCPVAERAAMAIADHRKLGSKITPIDFEKACQGRTANDIDDLQTYLSNGAGQHLDIIRKMRVVLETYAHTTYSASFDANDWLGVIVGKIRDGGASHPVHAIYDELDQINDYTKQYHHGEDAQDITPDQIDPAELTGYTKRTLRIVNALEA